VGETINGYKFALAFGILDGDYESPSDLNRIGYYSVYLEQWLVESDGSWTAKPLPLTFHKCDERDLPNFYKFQREPEL